MKVEWADPPPHPHKRHPGNVLYEALRQQLRKNPGKWAVVKRDGNAATAAQFRHGKVWKGYQLEQRLVDGRLTVYARWVGEEKP